MPGEFRWRAKRCFLCNCLAYRRCVGCERPVCRYCRLGAGWLVRCPTCPADVIRDELIARREAEKSARLRCLACDELMRAEWVRIFDLGEERSVRVRIWRQACRCVVAEEARELPHGEEVERDRDEPG